MGKELGIKAENYFASKLSLAGLPFEYLDDWYDFKVCGHPVEVKSCRLSVKQRIKGKDSLQEWSF